MFICSLAFHGTSNIFHFGDTSRPVFHRVRDGGYIRDRFLHVHLPHLLRYRHHRHARQLANAVRHGITSDDVEQR